MISTSFRLPKPGGNVLLSIGGFAAKTEFQASTLALSKLGFKLHGSLGTADFYQNHGIPMSAVDWLGDSEEQRGIAADLVEGKFDLVIILATRDKYRRPATYSTDGQRARRMAIDMRVPLITNIKVAKLFVAALSTGKTAPAAEAVDSRSTNPLLRLPGFIDSMVQVSLGDGDSWESTGSAAIAGGVIGICCNPVLNNTELANMLTSDNRLNRPAMCDYGIFLSSSLSREDLLRRQARAFALIIDPPPGAELAQAHVCAQAGVFFSGGGGVCVWGGSSMLLLRPHCFIASTLVLT